MEIITWDELKNNIKNKNNNVLLGNGFSMSYQMPNFNQSEIIKEMPTLKDLSDVNNIEICIKKTIEQIQDINLGMAVPKNIIANWVTRNLRIEFVETLFNKLPKSLRDIDGFDIQKINAYKEFFSFFDNTFTLNYDPLIYWLFLNFTNYGEQDFLELIAIDKQIDKTVIGSDEYNKLEKNKESKKSKCHKRIQKDFLPNYMNEKNDEYKVKIFYKNSCLMDDILGAAKYISKTIFDKVYNVMKDKVEEHNSEINQEKEKIDTFINTGMKNKTTELLKSQDSYNIRLSDGFYDGKWNKDKVDSQTLYFLHGALHIVENSTTNEVEKIQANDDGKMLDNIKKLWMKGFESLIVLESNADDKLLKINNSSYLKESYNKFENIAGNIVSFGVAFEESDTHIINSIKKNKKIEHIYIGGYSEKEIKEKLAPKFEDDPRVKFYITQNFFENIKEDSK